MSDRISLGEFAYVAFSTALNRKRAALAGVPHDPHMDWQALPTFVREGWEETAAALDVELDKRFADDNPGETP